MRKLMAWAIVAVALWAAWFMLQYIGRKVSHVGGRMKHYWLWLGASNACILASLTTTSPPVAVVTCVAAIVCFGLAIRALQGAYCAP